MKYVVQCKKKISCSKAGLGAYGTYQVGDLVSFSGKPTRKLDEACIYEDDILIHTLPDFPFDDDYKNYDHKDYFKKIPIKIVRKKR